MNRVVVILLLSVLIFSVQANDFRAANFGEDCASVFEYERSQKSIVLDDSPIAPMFQNVIFGKEAIIIYACLVDNKFDSGSISFGFNAIDDAVSFLEELTGQLRKEYGDPALKVKILNGLAQGMRWDLESKKVSVSVSEPVYRDMGEYNVNILYLAPQPAL